MVPVVLVEVLVMRRHKTAQPSPQENPCKGELDVAGCDEMTSFPGDSLWLTAGNWPPRVAGRRMNPQGPQQRTRPDGVPVFWRQLLTATVELGSPSSPSQKTTALFDHPRCPPAGLMLRLS